MLVALAIGLDLGVVLGLLIGRTRASDPAAPPVEPKLDALERLRPRVDKAERLRGQEQTGLLTELSEHLRHLESMTGEVLGFAVGDSEDGAFRAAFLGSPKAPGPHGIHLVIPDAHIDLKATIPVVRVGATWKRCRVHTLLNSDQHPWSRSRTPEVHNAVARDRSMVLEDQWRSRRRSAPKPILMAPSEFSRRVRDSRHMQLMSLAHPRVLGGD